MIAATTASAAQAPERDDDTRLAKASDVAPSAFKDQLSQAKRNPATATKPHPHQVRPPAKRAQQAGDALPQLDVQPQVAPDVMQVVAQVVQTILGAAQEPNAQPVVDVPHADAPVAIEAKGSSPDALAALPDDDAREVVSEVEATPVSADSATRYASESPLTPLERAIHEALDAAKRSSGSTDGDTIPMHFDVAVERATNTTATGAGPVAQVGQVSAPQPIEMPAATSHMHLVVGDGAERIVMTVAVRGSNVHVALRGADEHASAALARNAAVLDDALRIKQLRLAELDTTDDAPRERREKPQYDAPQREEPEEQEKYVHQH